jgi:hypothetical protein
MMTEYTYSRSTILEALRVINEFLVSMDPDRIGHDHGKEAWEREVVRSLCSHEIDKKMARVRRALSEPFSTELGDDDMNELERERLGIPYWTYAEFKNAQQGSAPDAKMAPVTFNVKAQPCGS